MSKASELRVALFVEGGHSPLPVRQKASSLDLIWKEHLPGALGLRAFSMVVPISKKHLVAMDPSNPPMSGAGEGLDQLMARMLKREPFDAAVIAWDLRPPWNPEIKYCRWQETLDLYRYLSRGEGLPAPWRQRAKQRLGELEARRSPSARSRVPRLARYEILGLCMDPMFESLLVQDEAAVKRALGLGGNVPGWPSQGWRDPDEHQPDIRLLAPAIEAARSMKPGPKVIAGVRGSLRMNKDGWGEFLLKRLLADATARAQVLAHPLSRRLSEIGPR